MDALTTQEFQKMRDENPGLLVVNTLNAQDFDKTKIPGSVNIPQEQDDFAQKVEEAAGTKGKNVVVYCASHDCHSSDKAAEKLEAAGFAHVFDYAGGAKAWREESQATSPPVF